jgi:hypothetical protein
MNHDANGILRRLAATSLDECLLKVSRVGAGTLKLLDLKILSGTLEDAVKRLVFKNPAAAVYFTLKAGPTLTALILFDPAEIECISRCYTGHSFPRGSKINPAEEVLLQELGNIILNSVASSVLNALKKSSMPSVPQFLEGDTVRLLEGLGAVTDPKREHRIIQAALAIQHDNSETRSELFAAVPEEMALALEMYGAGVDSMGK